MGIEGGIAIIRKAIQGTAEGKASTELLEKPEERHYKDAFHFYKSLRAFSPEKVELIITLAAKNKELKDEMGTELFNIYSQVAEDITKRNQKQIDEAVKQIEATKKSDQELREEISKLTERFVKKIAKEIKNDARIAPTFTGKEELLNKGIDLTKSATVNISDAFAKHPAQLKEISWKETMEMLARYSRGKPTVKELKEIQEYEAKMAKRNKWPQKLFDKIMNYFSGAD